MQAPARRRPEDWMLRLRWNEAALLDLGSDEYDFQEFKGSAWLGGDSGPAPDLHVNLSKQISAFANGAGGAIIIGLDDEGRIDGGVRTDLRKGGTRSWLEDIVPGLVDPPLARFNIVEVGPTVSGSRIRPGHAVYVISVEPSTSAPHQAIDHRYYLRIAGKSRPMGHIHLLDVLRRTRHPEVGIRRVAPFGPDERSTADPRGPKVFISMRAYVENRGHQLAHHVGVEMVLPRPLVNREIRRRILEPGDVQLTQRPGTVNFFRYHPHPIFPSQDLPFLHFWVVLHRANADAVRAGTGRIQWRIYADDAPVRAGHVSLRDYAIVREALAWLDAQG